MMGLKIKKRVKKAYGKNGNGYLREEINLLLMGLRIIKKMQEAYGGDGNRHLKEKMNLFTNKK